MFASLRAVTRLSLRASVGHKPGSRWQLARRPGTVADRGLSAAEKTPVTPHLSTTRAFASASGVPIRPDAELMAMAVAASSKSRDPKTKVGAVVVDASGAVVGVGYNRFLDGVAETAEKWGKDPHDLSKNKHTYVDHAEEVAIFLALSTGKDLKKGAIYTTLFPCLSCAKTIGRNGITHVFYLDDKDCDDMRASKILFDERRVVYIQCK